MTEAASGLRVLDLSTGPAGGLASMVLADFGADVMKIEPPGGDPYRDLASAPMWLRGKRSIELDLKSRAGQRRLHDLAREADVVLASYRPGDAERLGADAVFGPPAEMERFMATASNFYKDVVETAKITAD